MWRREWDSNPRLFRVTGFQDRLLKPLGHLSVYPSFNSNARVIITQLFPLVNCFLQNRAHLFMVRPDNVNFQV